MLGGATRGRSLSFQCHVAGNMILGLGAFEVIFVYCFIEYIGSLSVILIIALSFIQCSDTVGQERHSAHKPSATLACDRASQNLHALDADFLCKIRRMRICRTIKINTSCYSYCDST